jgi:hypothetical protein
MDDVRLSCHSRVQGGSYRRGSGSSVCEPASTSDKCLSLPQLAAQDLQYRSYSRHAEQMPISVVSPQFHSQRFDLRFNWFSFVVYFPTLSVSILYCANGRCMNLNLGIAGNVIDRVKRRSWERNLFQCHYYLRLRAEKSYICK